MAVGSELTDQARGSQEGEPAGPVLQTAAAGRPSCSATVCLFSIKLKIAIETKKKKGGGAEEEGSPLFGITHTFLARSLRQFSHQHIQFIFCLFSNMAHFFN